jgi:hypothetical protein
LFDEDWYTWQQGRDRADDHAKAAIDLESKKRGAEQVEEVEVSKKSKTS